MSADPPAGGDQTVASASSTSADEPVIDALAEVWASVVGVCSSLTDDEWSWPTPCPGWTVRDQLSHLIGIERLLLGDPPPPAVDEVPEHVKNPFGQVNESWVEARRATPGPEVLAEFEQTAARRIAALRSLPTEKYDEVGWSPVGEVPYREFMDTRVLDCWAHEQDIRQATGREGGRYGAGEASALERCVRTMPYVVGKRVGPPDGTSVRFAVSGPQGRTVVVTIDGGRGALSSEPVDAPAVTVSLDQGTFWRVGFGRMPSSQALEAGQIRFEGDVDLGRRIVASMPFMT